MPLITFHTMRVREALKRPAAVGTELVFLGCVAAVAGLLVMMGRQAAAPLNQTVKIDLSISALPLYTLLSLGRGFMAYALSLGFTLVYGTIAAHNRRAEKIMIPALDVLQAIPVLGFLPGLVLAMISLFPTREFGLEAACVIMIFTAQAWNMTFSFHGSLRGIPEPLREVGRLNRLSGWQTFRLLELPAAMIGLVWNSMMSMAGGWFFLTVNEAFTLGNHDYRLPGIGSYMNEAINRGREGRGAVVAAIVAMVVMIVVVDQLFWRPIVVWSQRFKVEDQTAAETPESWVLRALQKSRIFGWLQRQAAAARRKERPRGGLTATAQLPLTMLRRAGGGRAWAWLRVTAKWLVMVGLVAIAAAGAWSLLKLLYALPWYDRASGEDWSRVLLALVASFARTSVAVLIGAAWTLPAGILIGRSPKWSERLQPFIQIVASFPAPMLFPLVTMALLVLHVPFTVGCVALMLLGAQWYILFNVVAGAMAIPQELTEVTAVYGASQWQRWTRLYIPCVFPYLLTGLVTAAGGAWNATIVSEYVQFKGETYSAFGLGSLISHATAEGNFPLLAAAIVTMAVAVVVINRVFWKRLYRLAEERYSLNV